MNIDPAALAMTVVDALSKMMTSDHKIPELQQNVIDLRGMVT